MILALLCFFPILASGLTVALFGFGANRNRHESYQTGRGNEATSGQTYQTGGESGSSNRFENISESELSSLRSFFTNWSNNQTATSTSSQGGSESQGASQSQGGFNNEGASQSQGGFNNQGASRNQGGFVNQGQNIIGGSQAGYQSGPWGEALPYVRQQLADSGGMEGSPEFKELLERMVGGRSSEFLKGVIDPTVNRANQEAAMAGRYGSGGPRGKHHGRLGPDPSSGVYPQG